MKKDYSEFENKHWKILGDTGEINSVGGQIVVVLNKSTGKYTAKSALDITSRNQVGTGRRIGKKGAYFNTEINKWISNATIEGKHYYLGSFDSKDDATKKYSDVISNWLKYKKIPPKISKSYTGITGVRFDKRKNNRQWYALIGVHGKRKYLGYFYTIEEAIHARKEAEQRYFKEKS